MATTAGQLIAEAGQASSMGDTSRAIALLQQAVRMEPDNPASLNMLANRLMATGDADGAVDLLTRAVAIDAKAPELWLNLASAHRQRNAPDEEERALDAALALQPYFLAALLQKGELYERQERHADTLRAFSAAVAVASGASGIPPALQARLRHASDSVATLRRRLGDQVRAAAADTGEQSSRFDYCIDMLSGQKPVYLPRPVRLYFPGLPAVSFFDSALFPWFAELEQATDTIRTELLAVMAANTGMRPYVDIDPDKPVNQWDKLNRSLDWSAFFLWENGQRHEEHCAACPQTAALIERLPLFDVPGHAPTAMFSILKPGAHIPPHHGDSNIRAVIHLPLVVPPGCAFRVGAEQREWVEGVAWAFDDTIEHEAWNRSDQARAILIVDAWNPYLNEAERKLLAAAEQVMKSAGSL